MHIFPLSQIALFVTNCPTIGQYFVSLFQQEADQFSENVLGSIVIYFTKKKERNIFK
jgi:hypothetical protein